MPQCRDYKGVEVGHSIEIWFIFQLLDGGYSEIDVFLQPISNRNIPIVGYFLRIMVEFNITECAYSELIILLRTFVEVESTNSDCYFNCLESSIISELAIMVAESHNNEQFLID